MGILEDFLEVPMINKTVGQVVEDIFDVQVSMDEDCLNLAVSTPFIPSIEKSPQEARTGSQFSFGYF